MSTYVEPDLAAPLDLAAHLALAPRGAFVKGMFFRKVLDETRAAAGKPLREQSYIPFSNYPLADWLHLVNDAAKYAYPKLPIRAAMSRLGRSMYPTLADSMMGRVLLSVAGGSVMHALPVYPKFWSLINNHSSAELGELRPGHVIIKLRRVWDFVDSFEYGALVGGMAFFGVDAKVRVKVLGPADADYEVTWRP